MRISETELLGALREAHARSPDDKGFRTTGELCRDLGWSVRKVKDHLRDLKAVGQIELGKVHREGLDGRRSVVGGYRLIQAEKPPSQKRGR